METPVVRSRGRPRKRRREDSPNEQNPIKGVIKNLDGNNSKENMQNIGSPRKRGRPPKKRAVEIKGGAMIGRYVLKSFDGTGVFLGKIASYSSGLYRVDYEDGDREDLDSGELREFVIGDERHKFVGELLERKMKLDESIDKKRGLKLKEDLEKDLKLKEEREKGLKLKGEVEMLDAVEIVCALERVDPTKVARVKVGERHGGNVLNDVDDNRGDDYSFDDDDDDDDDEEEESSSDASEYGQGWETRAETEIPDIPPPELPPSSGTIGVPEECVSNLFSVYGFLRTFSIHLFLSPFTLDDLVGCLKCKVPNTLLDAIHVSLLRALKRHLEGLASEGSQLASKCLRSIDWGLLDTFTWPVYLLHYLMIMGHLNGQEWKGFYVDVLDKEYFTLSTRTKLTVLQILCDDALDTDEIRMEIDTREESEVGVDSDGTFTNIFDNGPRQMYPRSSKNGKHSEIDHSRDSKDVGEDGNVDECRLCGMEGMLICCDGCPSAYHSRCIGVNKLSIPDGEWFCPECTFNKIGPAITMGTSLRGVEVFGIDSYAQLFLGTCNHLLVLKVSVKPTSFVRYYNCNDIPKVISSLSSSPNHAVSHLGICQSISKYWELPQVVLSPLIINQPSMALENKDEKNLLLFQSHSSDENMNQIEPKVGNGTCGSTVAESCIGDAYGLGNNGVSLPQTHYIQVKEDRNKAFGKSAQKKKDTFLYMGSIFKPFAYINHYVHGAFAASAAANFADLSSDDNRVSGVHASDPRKAMAANVSLQAKAFSSQAVRFFWPSTEKKLVEIPRERCSWCFHCKAPVISKKACLLNQAALNATRAEMKFISGLRLLKIVEGGLYGIAAYVLFMEESLHGLLTGPFRSSSYREQWRKKVEQSKTPSEMKSLLLDFESNLSTIALSSEWTKLVDNWMDESSIPQSVAASGTTQKRSAGKRKKHLAIPDVTADDSNDSNESCWWRGGKLAKLVFQRGTFPRGVVRKAARQGCSRRLPGIYYGDASDVPKRSRQYIWKAAVEMTGNSSQLALQVRYLDQHIKWSDLVRPEHNLGDGKGPETDALAFRNAKIRDKKIVENKIMYGVAFGYQKHLSTRLMKSIIEKEESKDGDDTYWFLEARIPLYLIREYEENVYKTDLLHPLQPDRYSKHQRRQLKASRKEIFVYLSRKKTGLRTCPCASCHGEVLLEQSTTCNSCEGFCHKACTLNTTEQTNDDIEFKVTCRKCSPHKFLPQVNSSADSPTSPLAMQMKEFQNSAAVAKSGKLKPSSQQHQNSTTSKSLMSKSASRQLPSVGTVAAHSEKKLASNMSKSKKLHWGVIWKKKGSEYDGSDFRLRSIIFRGSSEGLALSPACHLCQKPYSPHLMYICCETCENWYHADSVNLDESKLPDLVGFKCCRCRRIKSPDCPYSDLPPKKAEVTKLHIRGPKVERVEANSVSEAMSEQVESLPSTPMSLIEMDEDVLFEMDDPDSLVLPVSQVEMMVMPKSGVDCEWNPSGPGPQKLPVRRHVKNGNDEDGLTWTDFASTQLPTSVETKDFPDTTFEWDLPNGESLGDGAQKLPVRRHMKNEKDEITSTDLSPTQLPTSTEINNFTNPNIDWSLPNGGGLDNGPTLNCDNLNYENDYEPQTYFSFTELLEVDNDGNQLEGADDTSREAWQDLPCEYSQNGFMEECKVMSFDEIMPKESSIGTGVDALCEVCHKAAPAPDLACQSCGIRIHRHCSPWDDDEVISGDTWSCGLCQGWS